MVNGEVIFEGQGQSAGQTESISGLHIVLFRGEGVVISSGIGTKHIFVVLFAAISTAGMVQTAAAADEKPTIPDARKRIPTKMSKLQRGRCLRRPRKVQASLLQDPQSVYFKNILLICCI